MRRGWKLGSLTGAGALVHVRTPADRLGYAQGRNQPVTGL